MSGRFSIDFHVHTLRSYDCLTPPKMAIEMARRRGLDGIAVTDHDTIRGAMETVEANHYNDFLVIPGIEVTTDAGDLIGLHVSQNIESRSFSDVIAEIRQKGGVAYLPHPIRTFGKSFSAAAAGALDVDVWERYNGRYSARQFHQSDALFDDFSAARVVCGSDAHFPWEIGLFRTVLEDLPTDAASLLALTAGARLEAGPRTEMALRTGITLGEAVKKLKRGQYASLGLLLASLPWKALRRSLRRERRDSAGSHAHS
jgi:predicted metal-dependent phosphoesterase TrpH